MDWRTITIFIEPGKDISIDLHGEFTEWELEAVLMRALEKTNEGGVCSSIELKEKVDGPEEEDSED